MLILGCAVHVLKNKKKKEKWLRILENSGKTIIFFFIDGQNKGTCTTCKATIAILNFIIIKPLINNSIYNRILLRCTMEKCV